MKAQFKYAFLHALDQRLYALAATVIINAFFSVAALTRFANEPMMIIGLVLSSLSIAGVFVVNIISDASSLKTIFNAPNGYLNLLTPVKSWKILLPRVLVCVVEDLICLSISIFGVVIQGLTYGHAFDYRANLGVTTQDLNSFLFGTVMVVLGYTYIIMLDVFGESLKSAFFSGKRYGILLMIVCVLAVIWVFNLANFALAPLGNVNGWNNFFHITLNANNLVHVLAYAALSFIKIAVLFVASSTLIERRINL